MTDINFPSANSMTRLACALGGLLLQSVAVAADTDARTEDFIQMDETVVSGNAELPKVLYIVPWKEPTGMPQLAVKPEFTESAVFRRLYPPAYRRELKYYQTLHAVEPKE